jgi:hypothetical protein
MTTRTRSAQPAKGFQKNIIRTAESLIKSYNPRTHSIDTHCLEKLGDTTKPDANAEDILIQQLVYGCHKEKPLLKVFIDDYYGDNAASALRADMTLYTILGYMAIFRIGELGFAKFKAIAMQQEPSKVAFFCSYVFNEENLMNTHRSSWMKVKDLSYVENTLIPPMLRVIPDMRRLCGELMQNAEALVAAEAAKKEAQARGEVGLPVVAKKVGTRPVSPNITRPKPPILPEPERISAEYHAKDVPGFLERIDLEKIAKKREEDAKKAKETTLSQYDDKKVFKFHKTKGVRPIDEVRQEIEEKRAKEFQFDASFYNAPPDFSKLHKTDFKANAAAILREDFLYRKQQAKDAEILRNYEEELRDPTEYYLWQKEMRERDDIEKLKHVALRREQAKQSAEEAKLALVRQREDNALVANMVREQGEKIKEKMVVEQEIETLQKQEVVQSVIAVRESKPLEARQRVLEEKEQKGKHLRQLLDEARKKKEEEDVAEELIQADKIRQLRAINTVHRKHIKVFDPTETAGLGLLDEISYMEMKVRQQQEKQKQEEIVEIKREEIQQEKSKKQLDLERRQQSILRARKLKADANQQLRVHAKEQRQQAVMLLERTRKEAEELWDGELARRQAIKQAEQDALRAEEERIQRQQQYLGVAHGQVAVLREEQMQRARERQERVMAREQMEQYQLAKETEQKEKRNKVVLGREVRLAKEQKAKAQEAETEYEKSVAIQKFRDGVLYKKAMFAEGQEQHARTRTVLNETNPYGNAISQEIRTMATRSAHTKQ